MIEDFFSASKYINISKSEYDFAKGNIAANVFSYLYQQGNKKIMIEDEDDKGQTFKIEKEEPTYIKYDLLPKQNENLYQYFGKSFFDNKLDDTNEQFKVFKDQVMFINNMIEPVLNDLGIAYQLHLAGGALRDHLLNRPIKDLDVLIEFNDVFQIDRQIGKNSSEKWDLHKEALQSFFIDKKEMIEKHGLNIFHGQSREKLLHEIIFQTMLKMQQTEVKDFFWESETTEKTPQQKQQKELTEDDSVIYDGLFSVLKINNPQFYYPVDLLLNSNRFSYLNSFDFDICKCAYAFKTFDLNEGFEPLYLYQGFINDVINSTLSLNTNIFNKEKQVDRCLSDHYLRLKKKYPEYEIKLIGTESIANKELLQYIEKAHNYHLLNDRLKPKDIKNKVKKI